MDACNVRATVTGRHLKLVGRFSSVSVRVLMYNLRHGGYCVLHVLSNCLLFVSSREIEGMNINCYQIYK